MSNLQKSINLHAAQPTSFAALVQSVWSISHLNVISLIVSNPSPRCRLNRLCEGFRSIVSTKGNPKGKATLDAEVTA
jgi:hypothetical protein